MAASAREPAHHASTAHNNYEQTPDTDPYPTSKSARFSRSLAVPPARWSFLSSPVPDLSFSSPEPTSTSFSFHPDVQFDSDHDRKLSGPREMPQSPGDWGSPSPRREHFDHLAVDDSGSRSAGGDSSLIDPYFAGLASEGGGEEPMEEDPTLLSISQYTQNSAASDVGEPPYDAPLSSTPPRSPQSYSAASSSFDITGRLLPSSPPSADPRLAFPFPEPPPRRWSFRTVGGFASGSHGQGSSFLPVDVLPGSKRASWADGHEPVYGAPPSARSAQSPPMHRSHTDPLPSSIPDHPLRPSISPAGASFSIQPAYSAPDVRPPPPVASATAARASRPRSRSRSNTVEEDGLDVDPSTFSSRPVSGRLEEHQVASTLRPSGQRPTLVSLADLRNDGTMGPQTRPGGAQVFPTPSSSPKRPFRGSIALPPSPALTATSSNYGYPAMPPPSPRTPTHQFDYPPPMTPTFSIASSRIPFLAPSPPPKDVLPPVPPSFTAIFVDPTTQSVRISRSYPSYTIPAPPGTSTSGLPTLRHRLSDWLLRRNAAPSCDDPDANAALGDLVARAREVETRLATGTDSPSSKAMKRRSKGGRAESFISRFSFPGQSDRSSWVRMGEEPGAAEGEKLRRRDAKARKKLVDSRRKTQDWLAAVSPSRPPPRWRALLGGKNHPASKPLLSSRRFRMLLGAGILLVVVVLAVAIGVSKQHSGLTADGDCSCQNGGILSTTGGTCSCSCKGNWGGPYCQLDGTCSSLGGYPLANGLASIAEDANSNDAFTSQINITRFALVVNQYLTNSTSSASTCTNQLALVALPNLPPATFPSRLDWVSEAIVWTLAMTESTKSGILPFARILSFEPLGDSPSVPNSNFQLIAGGYTFDFSSLTVTAPPSSWTSMVDPSAAQVALVSPVAENALDRMTAFAVAASSQRSTALVHRWAELNLSTADLSLFRSAIQAAAIVIPFDAGGQIGGSSAMVLAAAQTANTSFPPAIGCLPSLSAAAVSEINEVEVGAFGLGEVNGSASLDSACLDRPLYGFLDLLNLRLPYPDSDPRSNLPQQGLILSPSSNPRVTIHAGETLVGALSGSSPSPSATSTTSHFGTLHSLDHVILDILSLVSPSLARQLVAYVLSGATTPPTSSALLSSSIPPIEVQLWGGLRYANIDHSVSSLALASTPTSLFFGTSTGQKFRQWALGGEQGNRWTLQATEEEVVLDSTLGSGSFVKVWNATGTGGTGTPAAVWKALLAAGLGA